MTQNSVVRWGQAVSSDRFLDTAPPIGTRNSRQFVFLPGPLALIGGSNAVAQGLGELVRHPRNEDAGDVEVATLGGSEALDATAVGLSLHIVDDRISHLLLVFGKVPLTLLNGTDINEILHDGTSTGQYERSRCTAVATIGRRLREGFDGGGTVGKPTTPRRAERVSVDRRKSSPGWDAGEGGTE
jgi:hypothetical protein